MHEWSFIYQYAVGGAFFLITLYIMIRSRSLDLKTRTGRRYLGIFLVGLFLYAAVHAFSVFLLPRL